MSAKRDSEPRPGDRLPPQSLENEMAVLGCCMVDREMAELVLGILNPEDFYAVVNETIFRAIRTLVETGRPVDKIAVATYLRDKKKLDNVGGLPYLTSLLEVMPTAANAEYYAKSVAEKAQLRAWIHCGTELAQLAWDGEDDPEIVSRKAEELFAKTIDRGGKGYGAVPLFDAMKANYLRLDEYRINGLPTGAQVTPWPSLNEQAGPFMPGSLVAWVGAPAMGKTAADLTLADWCRRYGQVVLISLELSADEVAQRYAAMYGNVTVRRQREAALSDAEMERVSAAGSAFAGHPGIIIIDSEAASSLFEIRRELRRIRKNGPIATIIVDGITFLTDVDEKSANDRTTETQRLDRVYKAFLRIAKTKGQQCVVHITQHLNREGMKGSPTLATLRGGGNLEGHAHAIIAPYRENPYGTPDEQRVGSMIVLKCREGQPGTVAGEFAVHLHRSIWIDPKHNRKPFFEQPELRDSRMQELEEIYAADAPELVY